MDVPSRRWSLLLVGKTNGIVAQVDHDWSKHPDHYEKVVVVEEEHANREIERLRAELAEKTERLGRINVLLTNNGPGTVYNGLDNDVGDHGCCGLLSYKPHAPDCWFSECRTLAAKE